MRNSGRVPRSIGRVTKLVFQSFLCLSQGSLCCRQRLDCQFQASCACLQSSLCILPEHLGPIPRAPCAPPQNSLCLSQSSLDLSPKLIEPLARAPCAPPQSSLCLSQCFLGIFPELPVPLPRAPWASPQSSLGLFAELLVLVHRAPWASPKSSLCLSPEFPVPLQKLPLPLPRTSCASLQSSLCLSQCSFCKQNARFLCVLEREREGERVRETKLRGEGLSKGRVKPLPLAPLGQAKAVISERIVFCMCVSHRACRKRLRPHFQNSKSATVLLYLWFSLPSMWHPPKENTTRLVVQCSVRLVQSARIKWHSFGKHVCFPYGCQAFQNGNQGCGAMV